MRIEQTLQIELCKIKFFCDQMHKIFPVPINKMDWNFCLSNRMLERITNAGEIPRALFVCLLIFLWLIEIFIGREIYKCKNALSWFISFQILRIKSPAIIDPSIQIEHLKIKTKIDRKLMD
ncbi:hypothetical protein BpHYR1_029531 [Brachionus plicatilis]|uniref:Uncharacterized protein n=1 Tax=Brachionus plicatilis TaxID=10195 RepID=A0A3M7P0T6_BRAPC|nr:hypothetical protein BpHYR1_029531 [Brachionus plicatilis]